MEKAFSVAGYEPYIKQSAELDNLIKGNILLPHLSCYVM
jgi:hypothetical protein